MELVDYGRFLNSTTKEDLYKGLAKFFNCPTFSTRLVFDLLDNEDINYERD